MLKKIIRKFFVHEQHPFPYMDKHFSKKEDIVLIDLGAHEGNFIRSFQSVFGVKKCIMADPIPRNVEVLKTKFPDSEVYKIYENAVTSESGLNITFNVNSFDETSSLLEINNNSEELKSLNITNREKIFVKSITLDDIAKNESLDFVDLIKIDVQGSELEVLKSSIDALAKTEFIWVETSFKPLYRGSALFHEIHEFLSKEGFILLEISPGYRNPKNQEMLQVDVLFKKK